MEPTNFMADGPHRIPRKGFSPQHPETRGARQTLLGLAILAGLGACDPPVSPGDCLLEPGSSDVPYVGDASTNTAGGSPTDGGCDPSTCGWTCCGDYCVALDLDSLNCGACGKACPPSQVCYLPDYSAVPKCGYPYD